MKRLKKGKERVLFGVCSGIAEYLGVDPTIVRIIFVVAFVFEPKIALIYVLLAVIMPDEGERRENTKDLIAYVLIGLGVALLIKELLPLIATGLLAIILIAVGIKLLKS